MDNVNAARVGCGTEYLTETKGLGMLGKTVILMQSGILPGLGGLIEDLRNHSVEVLVSAFDEGDEAALGNACSGFLTENAEGETLCITDSENAYRILRRQGMYVLPCRHDRNRGADFKGAFYVIEQVEEIGFAEVDMAYRRLAGLPWEILTTKRCIVRETTVEDVDSFYEIYAEPDITKYMENLYADREEEIAYIEEYRDKVYAFYGYGMWTVLTKEGTVIGRAGISWREGFDVPELGFVIGPLWQRQGYAFEVCGAILAYAREELGITQMCALVMEGNGKSASLCRKLGFREQGSVLLEGRRHSVFRMQHFTPTEALSALK